MVLNRGRARVCTFLADKHSGGPLVRLSKELVLYRKYGGMTMNFWIKITPALAPSAPAIMLFSTYLWRLWDQYGVILGFLGACAIAATVEVSGIYIAHGAGIFIAERQWLKVGVCVLALAAYGYVGISTYWGTSTWTIFLLVTMLYVVMAMGSVRKEQRQDALQDAGVELSFMREKRLGTHANRRLLEAKAEAGTIDMSPVRPERSYEQSVNIARATNVSKQPEVWAWLDTHVVVGQPFPTVREVKDGVGINSTNTASKHMKSWKKEKGWKSDKSTVK